MGEETKSIASGVPEFNSIQFNKPISIIYSVLGAEDTDLSFGPWEPTPRDSGEERRLDSRRQESGTIWYHRKSHWIHWAFFPLP